MKRKTKHPVAASEPDWKTMALDCLYALRVMNAHYDDLSESNPGFMGKLRLQRYDLWNQALLVSKSALQKYVCVRDIDVFDYWLSK